MIKFYEPCKINKNDNIFQFINKINKFKSNENYYPVGVYSRNNKVIGILSLGDIRRIAFQKVNFKNKVINHLNKKAFYIDIKYFDSNLINRINVLMKKKKIEFIITSFNNSLKIVKISDLENLQEYKKTTIVGLGHIGLPLMVYLSNKVTSISGYDRSDKKVRELKKSKISFYEKNLKTILKQNLKDEKIELDSNLENLKSQNYVICIGSDIKKK